MVWLEFLLWVVVILIAGTKATRYADVIAETTGLGRIWIGLLLLGIVTSLPELITGLSSVSLVSEAGIPDLGLGTLLGSCTFNLTILAVMDVLHRGGPVLNLASTRQMTSAGIGILLFVVAALGIFLGSGPTLGWVGGVSIALLTAYLLGAWWVFRSERNLNPPSVAAPPSLAEVGPVVSGLWLKFALTAVMIIVAGVRLSFVGNEIAEVTSWDTSFVGSLFLAFSTSMPELVVGISALRIGAIDMAVADVLGANMLDVTYIFLLDLFYAGGPIFSSVSDAHMVTALVAASMSLIVIVALRFRQERKTFFVISWYGVLLAGLYIFNAYALFTSGVTQ